MLSDNNRNEHRKGQGGLEPAGALRTSIRDAREGEKERERERRENDKEKGKWEVVERDVRGKVGSSIEMLE